LFLDAGHSPKEISAKIDAAFQQLFHGDPETQTVYYPAGRNANGAMAYLADINNKDVRSEGMSYGMMIAVQLDVSITESIIRLRARAFQTDRSIDEVAADVVGRRLRFTATDIA